MLHITKHPLYEDSLGEEVLLDLVTGKAVLLLSHWSNYWSLNLQLLPFSFYSGILPDLGEGGGVPSLENAVILFAFYLTNLTLASFSFPFIWIYYF